MNILADFKTWRFWKRFLIKSFACGGFISAVFQFVIIGASGVCVKHAVFLMDKGPGRPGGNIRLWQTQPWLRIRMSGL